MTFSPAALPVKATVPAASHDGPPLRAVSRTPRTVAAALVALTKPRIIELLLVTTVPTMLLAQRGLPSLRLVLVTLIGGTLAAGSANTINCYIDRDIDAVMKRTSRRPLVNKQGVITPAVALIWGIVLGAGATALLGLAANWLAASLADAAILFYVFVYTLLLKRRSASNIVIGGAAGCFPVLVGWAAVKGTIAIPAMVLFAVIFLWTPPHFWALAMKFKDDYARANVPMLPVVASPAVVTRKIVVLLVRDGRRDPGPRPLRGLALHRRRGRPRRLVPARGPPPARPGHRRRRPPLPDAPVPPLHRLPNPPVRRRGRHRPPPRRPLVKKSTPSSRTDRCSALLDQP